MDLRNDGNDVENLKILAWLKNLLNLILLSHSLDDKSMMENAINFEIEYSKESQHNLMWMRLFVVVRLKFHSHPHSSSI